MSKFRNLDFTNYVNEQRKALITNARSKNRNIGYDASLGEAVSVNASIGEAETLKHEVRWIDIDGTVLKRELVEDGATITHPANPAYDPTYLEFDRWISTGGDMNNVTKDIDFGAYYKTKEVTIDGITARPTIYKCYFDSYTGLKPTVEVRSYSLTSSNPVKIDWGDGTIDTWTSGGSKTHTYAQEGHYVMRLVTNLSNAYVGTNNLGLFGSTTIAKALLAGYAGQVRVGYYGFYSCSNCRVILVPEYSESASYGQGPSYFASGTSVRALIVPVQFMFNNSQLVSKDYVKNLSSFTNMQYAFEVDRALEFAILEGGIRYLPGISFSLGRKLVLPDSIYLFVKAISNAYELRDLHLPSQLVRTMDKLITNSGELQTLKVPSEFTMVTEQTFSSTSFEDLIITSDITGFRLDSCNVGSDLFLPLTSVVKTPFSSNSKVKNVTFTVPGLIIAVSIAEGVDAVGGILTLPAGVVVTSLNALNNIRHIAFSEDFDNALTLSSSSIKIDTFISFANNCKDLTGLASKTLTVGAQNLLKLKSTFVDAQGNEVLPGTAGAISLYDKIIAKNWTVA